MPTRIELSDDQKNQVELSTGLKLDHIEIPDRVIISLTAEQQKQIQETTGQIISQLELSQLELKKITSAAPYEAGLTVSVGTRTT